jgi:hypothetical protein
MDGPPNKMFYASAEFVGSPVILSSSTALGAFVPGGMKEVFRKFGMYPGKWF